VYSPHHHQAMRLARGYIDEDRQYTYSTTKKTTQAASTRMYKHRKQTKAGPRILKLKYKN